MPERDTKRSGAGARDADWGANVPLDDVAGRVGIVGVGESEHTTASGRTPTEIAAVAVGALAAGEARVVVNSFAVAWASQRGSMTGGPGQMHAEERFKAALEVPFGWFPQPVYFATTPPRPQHEYGTTEAQLAAVAVPCRGHANRTPGAVMHDRPLTLDDYLA